MKCSLLLKATVFLNIPVSINNKEPHGVGEKFYLIIKCKIIKKYSDKQLFAAKI